MVRGVKKTRFSHEDEVFRSLLKGIRHSKGWTQVTLARKLRVPQSMVSKFESGERSLNFVETAAVCHALGVELDAFAREYLEQTGTARARSARRAM